VTRPRPRARPAPAPALEAPLSFAGPRLRALPAGPGQAGAVQACLEGAADYFDRTEGRPAAPDAAADLLADAEADARRRVLVLVPRAGGPAAGVLDVLLGEPEPEVAHVVLLLLRRAFRGLGYGRETVAALEAALSERGFRAVRLSVLDENVEARLFWERAGYAQVGRLGRGVTVYEKAL
jgi:ribosomal protein S18 acetylase RimI-like enzyme